MQENLLKEYGLYINGEWRQASDGATFNSTDPATGAHLAVCAEATKADVDAAVKAARLLLKHGRTLRCSSVLRS